MSYIFVNQYLKITIDYIKINLHVLLLEMVNFQGGGLVENTPKQMRFSASVCMFLNNIKEVLVFI